ncbi:MAG: threonine-phosphate decarboxylase [Brevibacillus sp.]|nr:threonine-phosphate decarboxylase [Brevibacillus sp.]
MKWLERYGHGGDIWTAADLFGTNQDELLDFSANINPLGPPPGLFEHLQHAMPHIVRYPDPGCRRLRGAIARKLDVKPEQILVGNGAAECIQLACDSLGAGRVGVVNPCFSEYESAARKAGCQVITHTTQAEQMFLPAAAELFSLIKRVDLLFLGHPNNPVGNLLDRDELLQIAQYCERQNVYLCMDEAFLDFLPDGDDQSLLTDLARLPHLLLFRSMTKMYAIPGLRLGYAIGQAGVIARMQARQIPWSVNGLAQSAGEWLLRHEDFVRQTQSLVQRERERIISEVANWPGIRVFPGLANYLLLYIDGIASLQLQERMAKRGILIRNCSMYPGLGEGYVRVAVKKADENRRMLDSLKAAIAECRGEKEVGV